MGAVQTIAAGLLASDGAVVTAGNVKPTAGQVLTAVDDSTAEWDDPAAGGGGLVAQLWPEMAALPDTNFASLGKTSGTNVIYKTLDYDQSTDESAYWVVAIPTTLTPSAAKICLHWTATAGTVGHAVYWDITTRSVGNDQVIDATTTPKTATDSGNDALLATGDIHKLEITLTMTDWAAGELLTIKVTRDANNGSDNLATDAKLLLAVLEIS